MSLNSNCSWWVSCKLLLPATNHRQPRLAYYLIFFGGKCTSFAQKCNGQWCSRKLIRMIGRHRAKTKVSPFWAHRCYDHPMGWNSFWNPFNCFILDLFYTKILRCLQVHHLLHMIQFSQTPGIFAAIAVPFPIFKHFLQTNRVFHQGVFFSWTSPAWLYDNNGSSVSSHLESRSNGRGAGFHSWVQSNL